MPGRLSLNVSLILTPALVCLVMLDSCILFVSYSVIFFLYMKDSVADPDSGSGAFLALGSGIGETSRSGFGVNILDHISESL